MAAAQPPGQSGPVNAEMTQLIRPTIIIALYALLLPAFGPLLDHHFVEWQHNHGHLYLDGRGGVGAAGHIHIYEMPGRHRHSPVEPAAKRDNPDAAIAYSTAYDGMSSGLAYLSLTAADPAPVFPYDVEHSGWRGYADRTMLPPGALVLPPRKPPRV